MDMKQILQAFDGAATKAKPAGVNDMKRFVSIINGVNTPVQERVITGFEEGSLGSDANQFLLNADKINDEVMANINSIKINADEQLLKDLMQKFNAFMTAYHAVGKEILQPDLLDNTMGEGAMPPRPTPQNQKRGEKAQAKRKADSKEQFLKKKKRASEGLSFKDYAALAEAKNKIKGADGKACWDGYRYAGTEKGKDKCVKVKK